MPRKSNLHKAAEIALKDYMGLSKDETLLVITDEEKAEIGAALYKAGKEIAEEAFYLEMKSRLKHGEEPPVQIAEMMRNVDVVICPTSKSLTHTKARRSASYEGVRIATMPGISKDMMTRCLNADSAQIIELTDKVTKKLKESNNYKVTTALGTDITFIRERRRVIPSTGVLKTIGASGNLPSGEVFFAPIEKSFNGKIVFDGSFGGLGLLKEPITINFKEGHATRISGGDQAKELSNLLNEAGADARDIAEFGIGTNYMAKITGNILEDEKVLGTIHFALGNNISMGGKNKVPIHIDGTVTKPNIWCDDDQIMKNGKIII